MTMLRWIFCVMIIEETFALPEYHQDDYDVKFERAAVVWYDHSIVRDLYVDYPFYNRSTRALNASLYLLHDMNSTDLVLLLEGTFLQAEVQLYKFLSNEYRNFPIRVGSNICVEYANNNFNIQELLRNTSNIAPCPFKKGLYYVRNFILDYTRLPPFIPRGRYKTECQLYYNKHRIANAESFYEIVDKPLKWNKN